MRILVLFTGALCGLGWWGISLVLGAKNYGVFGTHELTGVVSGAGTGAVVAMLSVPLYRRLSTRSLLWYSPLSVYLAIAVYGLIMFLIRFLMNDFHPRQDPVAVGMESIYGMWWGITFLAPLAIVVHLLAYANHRLLRGVFASRSGQKAGTGPWPSTT